MGARPAGGRSGRRTALGLLLLAILAAAPTYRVTTGRWRGPNRPAARRGVYISADSPDDLAGTLAAHQSYYTGQVLKQIKGTVLLILAIGSAWDGYYLWNTPLFGS